MRIRDIPKNNRPDDRLIANSPSDLSDAELLAIIFRTGSQKNNVVDLANHILSKNTIDELSQMSYEETLTITGQKVKSLQLCAIFELSKRTKKQKRNNTNKINGPKDIYNLFTDDLRNKKQEYLYQIILDTDNKIIKKHLISIGTLNMSLIHPREVFTEAIKCHANAIILVHNHPSGTVQPSSQDIEITEVLKRSGKILGIELIDHVIIAGKHYRSI